MPVIDTGHQFLPGPLPAGWSRAATEAAAQELLKPPSRHSDPKLQAVLDRIAERQRKAQAAIENMTPGDMAFALMRNVPRNQWDRPLADLGYWPRGSTIAEIRKDPQLRNFTTKQAIMQLFEMDARRDRRAAY